MTFTLDELLEHGDHPWHPCRFRRLASTMTLNEDVCVKAAPSSYPTVDPNGLQKYVEAF